MMLKDLMNKAIQEYNQCQYSQSISTLLMSDYTEEDFIVYYYLGLSYIKLGDFSSGKENLEHYIELDDNLLRVFQGRMLLAFSSIQIEDYNEAQIHLDKLLDSGYESAKLYSLVGFTCYKKNMISKSIMFYKKAIFIEPDNSNALNALGFILSDFHDELKEAESLCRRALSVDVDNPAYLDSLGWVCFRNKKISASESLLSRALELSPDSEVISGHISQLEKARKAL